MKIFDIVHHEIKNCVNLDTWLNSKFRGQRIFFHTPDIQGSEGWSRRHSDPPSASGVCRTETKPMHTSSVSIVICMQRQKVLN